MIPASPPFVEHQSSFFAHRITLEGLGEDALAQSLSTARVDMNPHQVDAALFALDSPLSKGVVLADEVGLGKTIEAGLVIAQRWAERRRRILLIVPASLRKQWGQELLEKFSLPSVIIENKTYNQAIKAGIVRPFEQVDRIVITAADECRSGAKGARLPRCRYPGFGNAAAGLYGFPSLLLSDPEIRFRSRAAPRRADRCRSVSNKVAEARAATISDRISSGDAYEPDFVVDTDTRMMICEVKARNELTDPIVQAKAQAAVKWCETANQHAVEAGGKPWSYALISDDQVIGSATLEGLMARFTQG
jgi:SNF2-related domain